MCVCFLLGISSLKYACKSCLLFALPLGLIRFYAYILFFPATGLLHWHCQLCFLIFFRAWWVSICTHPINLLHISHQLHMKIRLPRSTNFTNGAFEGFDYYFPPVSPACVVTSISASLTFDSLEVKVACYCHTSIPHIPTRCARKRSG